MGKRLRGAMVGLWVLIVIAAVLAVMVTLKRYGGVVWW